MHGLMSSAAILTIGKALAWVGIPLGLACWELWRLNRDPGREPDSSDWFTARQAQSEDRTPGEDA
jgi:hypothetical protein